MLKFWMSRAAVKIELSPEETDELNNGLIRKTEQRKVEEPRYSALREVDDASVQELGTRPSR